MVVLPIDRAFHLPVEIDTVLGVHRHVGAVGQYLGMTVYYVSNLATIAEAMREVHPSMMTAVPRKLAKMERVSHTAVGKNFIDLDLTDYKTGRPTKLSKVIKDKVALIDFWASWCGPCRREIPNIAKIHEKYNSKDFVVVSLNVWDKPEAQAKAIKDLKMTWTQLTDPTRNATETYGVDGIPFRWLHRCDQRHDGL